MKAFDPEGSYFALTLGANRRGQPFWSRQSHWVGWSDRNQDWEIRAASLVNPRRMAEVWNAIGQGWVSVHDDVSLSIYLRIGGNALVEKSVAEARLPFVIAPEECVHDGAVAAGGFGFVVTSHLPGSAVQRRAPDRKLRMTVLKRDGFRCVVCGRRPAEHVDLELHVHHLIPWPRCPRERRPGGGSGPAFGGLDRGARRRAASSRSAAGSPRRDRASNGSRPASAGDAWGGAPAGPRRKKVTQLAEWVRHGLHLADIGNVGEVREQFHRSHAVKGPIPDQDERELLVRHRRAAQPRIPHPVTGPWEHVSPRGDARVGHGLRSAPWGCGWTSGISGA
jgi:hypothetical protein